MKPDDVCQRLEDAWRPLYRREVKLDAERWPDLKSLAGELAPDELPQALVRLIEIDRWYREQLGCELEQSRYLSLFPEWPNAVREAFATPLDTVGGESLAAGEVPALRCPACARASLRVSSDSASFICHSQDCKGRFNLKPNPNGVPPVLATVGHYEIVGLLGQGGFARVWLAKDPVEQRYVALKIPKRTLDRALADRFIRETRCDYALLSDPRARNRIPQLINWGRDGDVDYIAFEFHNAVPLSDYLAQHETFSPRRAAKLCLQVALTLQIAHDNNIVHRDVKPSNILIQDHEPLLTDFGIAKVLGGPALADTGQTQGFLGTLSYASPEHRTPERIDARSDVFSLGIVLFQIITGQLPFDGADDFERFLRIADRNVAASQLSKHRPGVDPILEGICSRCLEKDPQQRYQSAAELARDLEQYLGRTVEESLTARPAATSDTERTPPLAPRPQLASVASRPAEVRDSRTTPRTTVLAWATALGLGIAAIGGALFVGGGPQPPSGEVDKLVAWFRQQLPPGGKIGPQEVVALNIDYERRQALDPQDLQDAIPRIAEVLRPVHSVKLGVAHVAQSLDDDYLQAMLQAVGPKVHSLRLKFAGGYTPAGLAGISACPNLVDLEFSGPTVSDLTFLQGRPLLQLRILSAPRLTDEHLRTLDTTELTILDLNNCPGIRFVEPPNLPKLRTLILSRPGIEVAALERIAALVNLGTLVLGDGDYDLADLQRLGQLERLETFILPPRLASQKEELQKAWPQAKLEFR